MVHYNGFCPKVLQNISLALAEDKILIFITFFTIRAKHKVLTAYNFHIFYTRITINPV